MRDALAGGGPEVPSDGPRILWRIGTDTPAYTADDLSGKGAEASGGRWNRAGVPMVYASESRALACLETLVHLARHPLPLNRYLVQITVPAEDWLASDQFDGDSEALVGWDAQPAGAVSIAWGTDWAQAGQSLIARVPSVVVPEESNVLINPAHPRARGLKARKVRKWLYDPRLGSPQPPPR